MTFNTVRLLSTQIAISLTALLVVACTTSPDGPDTPGGLGRTQQPINDGQLEPGQDGVVYLHHIYEGVGCTGTIIGQRVVLTAKHCVRANEGAGPGEYSAAGWTVNIGPSDGQIYSQYSVQEVRYTDGPVVEDNDVAVLIIAGVMTEQPYPLAGPLTSGFVGDSVYLIGYGVASCYSSSSGTKYRTTDQVIQFNMNNSYITQGQGVNQGDSGGPVFNTNYELVGVISAMGPCTDGLSFITRVDHFGDLIQTALEDTGGCYPTGEEICGDGIDNDCINGIDDGCASTGEPCTMNDDCSTGWCVNLGAGLVCALSCDTDYPLSGCSVGSYCSELSCGVGVCSVGTAGVGVFGSQCASDTQCESLYCRPAQNGTSYCGVPCDPNQGQCLPAEVCAPLSGGCGACQSSAVFTLPRGLGELCSSNNECLSGLCMDDAGIRYCSYACAFDPDCTDGYHCRSGYCMRGDPGEMGDPCVNNDDCVSPSTCYSDGEWAYCTQMGCDTGVICGPNMICTMVGQTGVCTLTTAPVGEACVLGTDCVTGACVPFDGDRFCTIACGRGQQCPSGTFCTLSDTGALACAPNSTPPEIFIPGGGSKGGCNTGSTTPGPVWGLIVLVLLGLRRRRTPS